MEIKNVSNSELVEVVKTLPLTPEYGSVALNLGGLEVPGVVGNHEEYVEKCLQKGGVPYLTQMFKMRGGKYELEKEISTGDYSKIEQAELMSHIIGGKIPAGQRFEFSKSSPEGFVDFKDRFLDILSEKGYEFSYMDISLTTYHLTGLNQGDYPDTTLTFNSIHRKLKLKEGWKITPQNWGTLKDWFEGLR
ncbi:hypothetical protein HN832_01700 [archaeon]|nr:hypothetical protein [archaeon]MBT4373070.1 hypothetical protein [archaeon]MBT4531415.1 hypothetical protein [archaeon]MBT7001407.1 hypothetical protein [archaeon]MBT7282107.1 hypothetical protein [archaeon]